MRLQLRTDERGRLVATLSSRPRMRIAGSAVGTGVGALGALLVLSSMSAVGRWWLVPAGFAVLAGGGLLLMVANRVDQWVFDGGGRRVERHRAALVPFEPVVWSLDDVLDVLVKTSPDDQGDVYPRLVMRLRSGAQVPMFSDYVPGAVEPAGGAAAVINEFIGTCR